MYNLVKNIGQIYRQPGDMVVYSRLILSRFLVVWLRAHFFFFIFFSLVRLFIRLICILHTQYTHYTRTERDIFFFGSTVTCSVASYASDLLILYAFFFRSSEIATRRRISCVCVRISSKNERVFHAMYNVIKLAYSYSLISSLFVVVLLGVVGRSSYSFRLRGRDFFFSCLDGQLWRGENLPFFACVHFAFSSTWHRATISKHFLIA